MPSRTSRSSYSTTTQYSNNSFSHSQSTSNGWEMGKPPIRKLVLCFDGTGNTFTGSSGDTNIVKLYDKLNRDDPLQFHYYQTGIGTYDIGNGSVNKGFLGSIRSALSKSIDQGFGTSFDHHVMAGYKFLMNHYNAGDKIYMFGFSRGAFTARFLARMINTVGLLSMGNDEMVPFAYQLYQRYEQGQFEPQPPPKDLKRSLTDVRDGVKDAVKVTVDSVRDTLSNEPSGSNLSEESTETEAPPPMEHFRPKPADATTKQAMRELTAFKGTFCRDVKVWFLGIFDCVNSVAVLENPREPATVLGTAHHVRHAVAVDEFRVKFKPALLHQDINAFENNNETVKEVWFPGNHGDVGGGWPIIERPKGFWHTLKKYFSSDRQVYGTSSDPAEDDFQLSDIPLDWMMRELELVNKTNDPRFAISFSARKEGFRRGLKQKLHQAKEGVLHDTMKIGGGISPFKVIMWKFMEYLPVISRYELEHGRWVKRRFPLNKGSARDIPLGATLHQSLVDRLSHGSLKYRPRNNHGEGTNPCLLDATGASAAAVKELEDPHDLHQLYTFDK